ncbi:Hemerythrin HHE cation binding domain protein [uncultured archaeon]|nr:Hemerythrin HHE cation binding domain protein [uncultured archaeon]
MKDNIFTILKDEHDTVKKAFKNVLKKNSEEDFDIIKTDLMTHLNGEEECIYPVLEDHEELRDLILESYEEHRHAKMILNEIMNMQMDEEEFKPKLKVLMDMVEHHIHEEEKNVFPKAKKLISKEEINQITIDYINGKAYSIPA